MQNTWLENRIHKWHYDHLEGGGGVSDFSIAEITVTKEVQTSTTIPILAPLANDESPCGAAATNSASLLGTDNTITVKVILYKGQAILNLPPPNGLEVEISSGDIQSLGQYLYLVKSDGNFIIKTK